jgi:hypothetical protein
LKKSPPIARHRDDNPSAAILSVARVAACGWSNTIPRRFGFAFSIPIKSAPLPPPTSTTVPNAEKS